MYFCTRKPKAWFAEKVAFLPYSNHVKLDISLQRKKVLRNKGGMMLL